MKKIISLILFAALMLSVIPAAADDDVNIAEGMPAYASTKFNDGYDPSNVTDGNENSNWSAGSVYLLGSRGGYDGWVGVDLKDKYKISKIVVKSRRDMDQDSSRRSWVLQVANDENYVTAKTVGKKKDAGDFCSDLEVELDTSETYRYVRICTEEYNIVVSEIEVYGSLPDNGGTFKKFDDTSEKVSGEANFLKKMNVMEGVDGTEFGAETLIKRRLAAKLILGLIGMDAPEDGNKYYDDVEPESKYAESIAMCRKLGIISDGDRFYPDEYIKTLDFLKMAECAIGYGTRIKAAASWSSEVTSIAAELRLMKNCDAEYSGYLNRENAVHILFNTLFANMMETRYGEDISSVKTDGTLIESVYKMNLQSGIVEANEITSLISDSGYTSSGKVVISGNAYRDLSGEATKLIGKRVKYILDEENNIEWCWEYENNELTLKNDIIKKTSGNTVEYGEEKTQKIKIENGADFILNGAAYRNWKLNDLVNGDGYTTFVDNNNDSVYEVIFRYEPQILIADFARLNDDEFVIVGKNGEKFEAKGYEILNITKNGKKSSAAGIKENSVVYCYASPNGRSVEVDVQGKVKELTVESADADGFTADGTYYEFSDYYIENYMDVDILNKTLLYILNNEDEIMYVEEDGIIPPQNEIAYMQKIAATDGMGAKTQLRVFTQNGAFKILTFADKTKIDGKKYSSEEVISKLGEDYFCGKFATYEVKDGIILSMDTENYSAGTEPDSKFLKTNHNFDSSWRYFPAHGGIFLSNFMVLPILSDTVVFDIPLINGSELATEDTYDSEFKIKDAQNAFGSFADMTRLGVLRTAFYAADENGYPAFAVRYSSCSKREASGLAQTVKTEYAGSMIVTKKEKIYDGYAIYGTELSSGSEVTIKTDTENMIETHKILREKREWIKESGLIDEGMVELSYISSIDKLKKGDLIRYDVMDGIAFAVERILEYETISSLENYVSEKGSYYSTSREYPDYPWSDFRLMLGTVKKISGNTMVLETTKKTPEDTSKPEYVINYKTIPTLITFNGEKVKKEKVSTVNAYINRENTAVLFLAVFNAPKTFIVYEY